MSRDAPAVAGTGSNVLTAVRGRLATSLKYIMSFAVGVLLTLILVFVHSKASMMDHASEAGRLKQLLAVSNAIGLRHLQSCEAKVGRLHQLIADSSQQRDRDELSRVVASVLLDGPSCNGELLAHIDSRAPLPDVLVYREFRLADINGPNIGAGLRDEQGLVLWILARTNPDRLLPGMDYCLDCGPANDSVRASLVEHWRHEMRR